MIDSTDRAARILVAYYSATGHVHALAKAVAEGAGAAGAEVRCRETTVVAVAQGRRLARVAQVIGVAREHGLLDVRAGVLAELCDSQV
jgi:hypothetical protein